MDKKTIITPTMLLAYAIVKKLIMMDNKQESKIKTFQEYTTKLNERLTGKKYRENSKQEQFENVISSLETYIDEHNPPSISDEVKMDKYALDASNYLRSNDFIGDTSSSDFIRNVTMTDAARNILGPQIEQAVKYEEKLSSAELGRKQAIGKKKKELERITADRYDMEAERDEQKALATQRQTTISEQEQKLAKKKRKIEEQKAVIVGLNTELKTAMSTQNKGLEKEVRKLLKSKSSALRKGEKEFTQLKEQLGQIDQKISDTSQQTQVVVRDTAQQTQQEFKRQFDELKVASTIRGNQRQKITPEKKEGKERESKGLGLSSRQRTQLKQIITTETNAEYANVVDMIAGDNIADMTPYDLTTALIGLGLSVAIPIPNRLYTNVLQQLGRETGFAEWFNNLFETQNIDGDNIVLEQKNNVRDIDQVINTIPASISGVQKESKLSVEDDKHTAGPGSTDLNAKADLKQQRDNRGRFTKKMQTGAAIAGLTTYAATGSTPAALVGAGAGALAVAAYPAINQIAGPTISRIGDALAERMPDTIPTATGVKRAIQRQITTDTKDIPNPIPTLSRRGANQQEMATAYNRIDVLDNEYNELKERQRTLEAQMMANIDMGISNTELGLTGLVRRIAEQLRQNRDEVRQINDEIDQGPRTRVDFNREGLGIPIPRRTTDEEKALVPFNEAEERTTYDKKKALAVAGAVGGAVVAGGIAGSGTFKERPIEVPSTIYSQQQGKEIDTAMPNMARGLLRPKFIMPDADILQPSNQELAADALEFAMFDFVEPSSEGAEGTNQTNILKAFQKENENIRYRGAGVVVNSLFGNDANDLTTQQINKMFLGPELPPMIFSEIQQNLSEYEVNQFDVNNEITGIEFFSPYNNFTDVNPGLNENMSMLFDVVP
jgi:hypothetical protein